MIIGITGRAGAGKDTCADILVREHKAVKVSLADEMKRIVKSVYGFTDEQLWGPSEMRNKSDVRYPRAHSWTAMDGGDRRCLCCGLTWEFDEPYGEPQCYLTPRYALQLFGTEWGRHCFEDTWIRKTMAISLELLRLNGTLMQYDRSEGIVKGRSGGRLPDDVDVLDIAMVVIPDVRYDNEAKAIKAAGGKIIAKASSGVTVSTHSSEAGISETLIDAWIPHVIADDHQKLTDALAKHVRAIVEGT